MFGSHNIFTLTIIVASGAKYAKRVCVFGKDFFSGEADFVRESAFVGFDTKVVSRIGAYARCHTQCFPQADSWQTGVKFKCVSNSSWDAVVKFKEIIMLALVIMIELSYGGINF